VIIGKFFGRKLAAAILTTILVPGIDVLPGEFDGRLGSLDHPEEPHHSRQPDTETDRVDLTTVFLKNLDLFKKKQPDRPLPVNDLQRFISDI
jgi:hypothetical protein